MALTRDDNGGPAYGTKNQPKPSYGKPAEIYPIPGAGDPPLDLTPSPVAPVSVEDFATWINSVFGLGPPTAVGGPSPVTSGVGAASPGKYTRSTTQPYQISNPSPEAAVPYGSTNRDADPGISMGTSPGQMFRASENRGPYTPTPGTQSEAGQSLEKLIALLKGTGERGVKGAPTDASTGAWSHKANEVGPDGKVPKVPGTPGLGYASGRVQPMSERNYNALTEEQRGAVDFNTLLGKAVRRDLKLQDEYKASGDEKSDYDKRLAAIFGEDGGSQKYAPETLALLEQIMFKDQNADMDDFLGMNMAVTAGALTELPAVKERTTRGTSSQMESRAELAAGTNKMQETIAQGEQLLHSVTAMARKARQGAIGTAGGIERDVPVRAGYGPGKWDTNGSPLDQDAYFQKGFDLLSVRGNEEKRPQILQAIRQKLAEDGPRAYTQFLEYADDRSRIALENGVPMGDGVMEGKPLDYLTPEEFRAALGLDRKGSPARKQVR
jgi:hypothetical protein